MENLFPSATSHQSLLSGLSLLVSLSVSQSKSLLLCFIHASFYHLITELLCTLFTAKSSPFFFFLFFLFLLSFFFFLFLGGGGGGVLFFVSLGFLSLFFAMLLGELAFPAPSQAPLRYPQPAMMGRAWGEVLWEVGGFDA